MKCSRRYLLNDMAKQMPILKNNQNTYHPRFGFTPKIGITFPKTGFCFYCELPNEFMVQYRPGEFMVGNEILAGEQSASSLKATTQNAAWSKLRFRSWE